MFPHYVPDWYNPKSVIINRNETDLRVDILPTRSQIYVFGADRPDLMRGPNPQGVVLDEFSVQKAEVWNDIIQPVMRANPTAWTWFLFTPRGKNHAHTVYEFGLRGDDEWKSWKLTVLESGIFAPIQIENARRDMPENTFKQELMCEFLEGEGSVFTGVREAMTSRPEPPKPNHLYVMGVDLAKVTDYTVITVYDRQGNNQVYQDRFNALEWPFQKQKIFAISRHYNNALCVLDATGLGDPVADDLVRIGIPVEPVKITEQIKKEMIEKLSIWLQLKKCAILPVEETLQEFDNFSYEIGPTGKVRYQARQGFHDDIVVSHALAVYRLTDIVKQIATEDTPLIRQEYLRQKYNLTRDSYGDEWNS